jgi:nitroreductase/NAD-dependent dihydropyrimidine dehydrogenase PreA subunit
LKVQHVDKEKCIDCGQCRSECPRTLFTRDLVARKHIYDDPTSQCFGCGHCIAVCPTDAIVYSYDGDSHPIPPAGSVTYDALLGHMAMRRSVRRYTKQPVSREQIEKVLEAIRCSPSASNKRSWSFIVITDPREIKYLAQQTINLFRIFRAILKLSFLIRPFMSPAMKERASRDSTEASIDSVVSDFAKGRDRILFDAPCVIILHSPSYAHMTGVDAGIALTQGVLAAHALELGTCWVGFLIELLHLRKGLRTRLGIPKKERVWGVLTLGHPEPTFRRAPPRDKLRVRWIGDHQTQ